MWLLVSVLLDGQSACCANGIKGLGMATRRLYREHSRMVDVPPNLVHFVFSLQAVLIRLWGARSLTLFLWVHPNVRCSVICQNAVPLYLLSLVSSCRSSSAMATGQPAPWYLFRYFFSISCFPQVPQESAGREQNLLHCTCKECECGPISLGTDSCLESVQ